MQIEYQHATSTTHKLDSLINEQPNIAICIEKDSNHLVHTIFKIIKKTGELDISFDDALYIFIAQIIFNQLMDLPNVHGEEEVTVSISEGKDIQVLKNFIRIQVIESLIR